MHYLYEPGSFVPVAQALRKGPVRLHKQPDWSNRPYDFDEDPLWQTEVQPQAFDAIAWYHCDHLGTPMELTDEQGHIAWTGQYKAWGGVREERSDWARQVGLSNPVRFQGQYHDHETELHYNRYRYYDPRNGRFINHDLSGYLGGLNLFIYALDPINWVDPLGLAKRKNEGTPKDARRKVFKKQAPTEIIRIDEPEQDVPKSQWHAHCPCGSGYNLDGSIHDKGKGDVAFSRKTIQWLNNHGWNIKK